MIINFSEDTIEDTIQKVNEELKAYGLVYTQIDSSKELCEEQLKFHPLFQDDLGQYRLEKIND